MATQYPETFLDAVLNAGPRLTVPGYDRGKLIPSVVHIGVGSFHRAHQAIYFEELAAGGDLGWGVVGVGLRRRDMGVVLGDQYGLFTVVERQTGHEHARFVGSQTRYLFAPEEHGRVVDALADPRTRLVTITVTGDGYLVDPHGRFMDHDPGVVHDLEHPERPETMAGFLVEGLHRRRARRLPPFTVLSCDNIPDNGAAARTAVTSLARLRDPELAEWIDASVTFPASMVDRITPETSPVAREEIAHRFGVPDRWPVVTEAFRQWVIEDRFCNGRPPLERVGVLFVPDVGPYKRIKSRVVNGGHCAIGFLGTLLGYRTIDEAMRDPALSDGMARMLRAEVVPHLPEVAGMPLAPYVESALQRFANPAIADSLTRLCRRGSSKVVSYLLPSLRDAIRSGSPHRRLVVAVAAWMRYLRGTDLAGRPLQIHDAMGGVLCQRADEGGDDARALLGVREVFGDLVEHEGLVAELSTALRTLSMGGPEVLGRLGWAGTSR